MFSFLQSGHAQDTEKIKINVLKKENKRKNKAKNIFIFMARGGIEPRPTDSRGVGHM